MFNWKRQAIVLRRTVRALKQRVMGGIPILLYHRVSNEAPDPQLLSVTPANFAEHIDFLKSNYTIVALDEIPNLLKSKKRFPNLVALTFDDGYADNYWHAFPVLSRYGVPASVFVV